MKRIALLSTALYFHTNRINFRTCNANLNENTIFTPLSFIIFLYNHELDDNEMDSMEFGSL